MTYIKRKQRGRVAFAAALLALAAPLVHAGPEQDTEQAEKEFARGGLVPAMALWRKAANEGYAPAQARLGDILDKAEEDDQAVSWYRKAADQGNGAGLFGLGSMYGKGEGVTKDLEQARKYILLAAEKDYLPAVVVAADMYKFGTYGAQLDVALHEKWKVKAAELGAKEKEKEKALAEKAKAEKDKAEKEGGK